MPTNQAYRATAGATLIRLCDIEPPFRSLTCPLDFHGLGRERLIRILKGIVADDEIEPVAVLILPPLPEISKPPFKYRVLDGWHRFYASVAAGFKYLPVSVRGCWQ